MLWSLEGNDKIYAGLGDDTINGGAGNVWLEGEEGSDFFTGGTGSDRFVFREGDFGGSTFSTADVIVDFSSIENDIIRLDLADANSTLDGDQDFTFLGTDAFTGAAGELRYYQNNGDTYLIGDTDGDGIHDIMIRLLGTHDLTGGDFIL